MPRAKKTAKPEVETEPGNDLVKNIPEFTVKKAVSLPILKWEVNTTIYIRFDSVIETRDTVDEKTGEPKTIDVVKVSDLTNDEAPCDLVCGVALKKKLELEYEDGSYNGLCFKMTKHPVAGKRYNTFEIYEIEV